MEGREQKARQRVNYVSEEDGRQKRLVERWETGGEGEKADMLEEEPCWKEGNKREETTRWRKDAQ